MTLKHPCPHYVMTRRGLKLVPAARQPASVNLNRQHSRSLGGFQPSQLRKQPPTINRTSNFPQTRAYELNYQTPQLRRPTPSSAKTKPKRETKQQTTKSLPSPSPPLLPLQTMAERDLQAILTQLKSQNVSWDAASSLLSKAKLLLLKLSALSPSTPPQPQPLLALARETYEQGALHSIRARDPDAFTRYVTQLAPFYELPAAVLAPGLAERNRVTGLYLLLLLTQGRYAEFHSELESLSTREGGGGSVDVEGDRFLGYPIRLERWLMEGSYDRVWKAMKSREVPSEEYAVFSEVSFSFLASCTPTLSLVSSSLPLRINQSTHLPTHLSKAR